MRLPPPYRDYCLLMFVAVERYLFNFYISNFYLNIKVVATDNILKILYKNLIIIKMKQCNEMFDVKLGYYSIVRGTIGSEF